MRYHVMLWVVTTAGCASSSAVPVRAPPTETVRIVGPARAVELTTSPNVSTMVATVWAALEQAWRLMPAVYESLGIPLTTLDSVNHVVGNAGTKVRGRLGTAPLSRYLDCGDSQGVPSAESYEIQLSVLTQLQPAKAGGITVGTTVQAGGRPVSFSGDFVRCASRGELESRLVDTLKARLLLSAQHPPP